MATAERHPTYRNILLVTGEDIAGDDPRQALIDALEASGSSAPVRRGTHDIWVTYQVATQSGANHSFGDEAAAPRPRRGVVQMGVPPTDSSEASLQDQIGTMLQECGHSWLVPYELGIRDASAWPAPQQPYLMPSDVEVATAQADGSPYTGPLLLGRTNQHWSTFFDGDGSPFDGMHWRELPDADGVVRWQWDAPPTYAIAPPGLGSISLGARYNDLDLLVMGVKTAQEAYAARSNRFRWLEPQLMAPIEYHAGVCIAFGPGDFHYCGFYRDHQTVGVQATGGALTSYPLPDYRRFGRGEERLALRVLKRGSQYHYQVRRDHPAGTPLSARLLDALDPIPSAGAPVTLDTWQTIATLTHAGSPLAVGTIVKTWSDVPPTCAASFLNLEIGAGSNARVLTTTTELPAWSLGAAGYAAVPDRLVAQTPVPGQRVRVRDGRATVTVPYGTFDQQGTWNLYPAADHWATTDRAAKLLARAPAGDWSIATSARIERSGLAPWAAGAAVDKTMWGRARSASTRDVILSDAIRRRQSPPPDNTYKVVFMLLARRRSDISDDAARIVDTIRRYWDTAFELSTVERRHSNSTL